MTQPQIRKHQVCDRCGRRFGMVTHRWWGNKFCRRSCRDAYLHEIALDRAAIARWFGVVQLMHKAQIGGVSAPCVR
jgi:hypothetical protein